MCADIIKRVKTFRLSPAVIELLERAASETGLSEGDIVEGCIVAQAEHVVGRHQRVNDRLRSDDAVRSVATAATRRPREERSERATKEAAAPAGLKKTQRS